MGHHVATFWYLATDDPAAPFRAGLPSDPGFARRLLSRLYPTVTVASLGAFPLNRSASTGPGEIYVGSFPGLTVVQTPVEGPVVPSSTAETWLRLVEAPVILLFAQDPQDGVSGFARWESGKLVRAFAGTDDRIVEDEGMPLPFERPYWAGEFPIDSATDNPLALPFSPSSLLHAAHRDWLGFDLEAGGPDVPVHGFATDGRREVRQHTPPSGPALHVAGMPGRAELNAAARRAAGSGRAGDGSGGPAGAGGSGGADGSGGAVGDGRAAGAASPYEDDDYERLPSGAGVRRAARLDRVRGLAGVVGDAVRRGADAVSERVRRRSR